MHAQVAVGLLVPLEHLDTLLNEHALGLVTEEVFDTGSDGGQRWSRSLEEELVKQRRLQQLLPPPREDVEESDCWAMIKQNESLDLDPEELHAQKQRNADLSNFALSIHRDKMAASKKARLAAQPGYRPNPASQQPRAPPTSNPPTSASAASASAYASSAYASSASATTSATTSATSVTVPSSAGVSPRTGSEGVGGAGCRKPAFAPRVGGRPAGAAGAGAAIGAAASGGSGGGSSASNGLLPPVITAPAISGGSSSAPPALGTPPPPSAANPSSVPAATTVTGGSGNGGSGGAGAAGNVPFRPAVSQRRRTAAEQKAAAHSTLHPLLKLATTKKP